MVAELDVDEAFVRFRSRATANFQCVLQRLTSRPSDLWVYDPPYADAVHYHEITEFFIAWLRRNPPGAFADWTWDSLRPYAIQGKGDEFRAAMAKALAAMAAAMPENGLHVCMFTHQDAQVWADLAEIVWSAGLQVSAAWYVSTEAENAFRAEGHVQGTVLLVLRKRAGEEGAWTNDLVPELRYRVEQQVNRLLALDAVALRDRGEHAFSSSDIQMAGYAAALEVLTGYTRIDGEDMTRAALRPRTKGDAGIVGQMIELAVQTAAELLVPEGFDAALWQRLNNASERFWLKMAEIEGARPAGTPAKLDEYQTFAKAFRCTDWHPLMEEATRQSRPAPWRRRIWPRGDGEPRVCPRPDPTRAVRHSRPRPGGGHPTGPD